jgi:glycosyl transferase family 2
VSAVSAVRPAFPALAPPAPRHEAARRAPRRAHPRPGSRRSAFPTISVVVPARNEARNLEIVLPAIAAVRPLVHEIIVVDGNSTDGTIAAARRALPWVRVIRQTRRGKGNAMACGFAAATGDVIVMFDADGSADPAEIPTFVAALIAGADFAKGSRFATGGGSDDITLLRRTGNAGLNGVANALFNTSYTDLCYGYNAFWADLLPLLDLPDPTTPAPAEGMLWGDGFEIETVLNCRVAAAGLHITEVPSVERQRLFGRTNLRTFADGTRVLRTLLAERRRAVRQRGRGAGWLVPSRLATEGFGIWAGAHRAEPVGEPVRVNGHAGPVDDPAATGEGQLDMAVPSAEGYRDAGAIGEALALTPSGGVALAPREPLDAGHVLEEEPS